MRNLVAVAMLAALLGACAGTGGTQPGQSGGNTTTGGTPLAAGVAAGGLIGHSIGQQLDRADRQAMARSTQTALETSQPNQPLPWQNQENGHHGMVVPGPYYQTAQGNYCREFQQTIIIGGDTRRDYGRACRQPDGTWKMVKD